MNAYHDKRITKISRQALQTLAGLKDTRLNPLSPLAIMELGVGGPAGAGREEMAASLEGMDGLWEWAAPALVDPRRTAALLFAGQGQDRIGQYLFPDPEGAGPAFNVSPTAEGLELSGPWSLGEVRMAILDMFSLEAVADLPPVRLDLTRRQFLGLAALVDAYLVSRMTRGLMRVGGLPEGLSVDEVTEAWSNGIARTDPEWAVSMLSLLGPDPLPAGFEKDIPGILKELVGKGLLEQVDLGGKREYYAPRGVLKRLCLELAGSNAGFGLSLRRVEGPGRIEVSTLFGWRTAGGIWLADPSAGGEGPSLLQVGPYLFMEFLTGLLEENSKEASGDAFSIKTPFARDALVLRLRAVPDVVEAAPGEQAPDPAAFCAACGNPIGEGLSFCNKCGRPVRGTPPRRAFCKACGNPLREGLVFCNKCGKPV